MIHATAPPSAAGLAPALALALLAAGAAACTAAGAAPRQAVGAAGGEEAAPAAPGPRWSIALHGGAGTIPRDLPPERAAAYRQGLARALALGAEALARGESSLDTVERVVRALEEDPLFNAGRGAVFTHVGTHELDAAIMDGRDLSAGAVAAVRTVRNPVSLARLVMTRTDHVLLVGEGAEAFADETGVERVENRWFDTPERHEAWQRDRARAADPDDDKDTVGCVARDVHGHLAAATSTGGLSNKRWGRVGDVPILGAGTYADDRTAALSATGKGEEFIRHGVTRAISARMELAGESLEEATRTLLFEVVAPEDGGIVAVDATGRLVLLFNTPGMYRGAADSSGRFEVGIWEELEAVPRP